VHAKDHQQAGPRQQSIQMKGPVDFNKLQDLELYYDYDDLTPMVDAPYKVTFAGGTVAEGVLDENGYALLQGVPNESYIVAYGEDARPWEAPELQDDAKFKKTVAQEEGKSLIEQALKSTPPLAGDFEGYLV
jgi:type VI secretion system secreted protein VgrG